MNARKGDHEERAEDAPKWVSVPRETGEPKGVKGYSGSIKRVDKVKSEKLPSGGHVWNSKLKTSIINLNSKI